MLHDIHKTTVDRVADVVKLLKAAGYNLTTVHDCLNDPEAPYRGFVKGVGELGGANESVGVRVGVLGWLVGLVVVGVVFA